MNKILDKLSQSITTSHQLFSDELDTAENKDYRRGYLAGMLVAQLELKNMLLEMGESDD